jgi:hypothetical protein
LESLFSSNHDGERASAALKADQLIRSRGLTWKQIITVAPPWPSQKSPPSQSWGELLAEAQANIEHASLWEESFLWGISRQRNPLSASQQRKLAEIVRQLRERRSAS